jgi:hypothetical protein
MTFLLDALAVAAVIGAVVYLWRSRKAPGCGGGRRRPVQQRIGVDALRASARRAAGRE